MRKYREGNNYKILFSTESDSHSYNHSSGGGLRQFNWNGNSVKSERVQGVPGIMQGCRNHNK